MSTVNTSLTFFASQQSVWKPGKAENYRIDTGDLLIWDPDEQTKSFDVSVLGFGLSAEAYLDVRFGLLGWADLGTGGSFNVNYDIDLFVEKPDAVFAGDSMNFRYSKVEVTSASVNSVGFGNSLSDDEQIGAGLDLIIEIESGMRNVTFEHWFGTEETDGFKIIDVNESITLISVTPDDAEISLEKGAFTFTARLPRGANVEGTSESVVVAGDGVSDVRFLELSADLDELLTELLGKIPLPPVKAIAAFLENTVFAEHVFDIHDYVSFVPAGKFEFKFILLDIGASAGINVTEDVIIDISGDNNSTPEIRVTLTSDNGTANNANDDRTVIGFLQDKTNGTHLDLNLTAPTFGQINKNFGDVNIHAEYDLNSVEVKHNVGLALTASITIDALQGKLDGSWVPEALKFSFGPLLSLEFPEGGIVIKLGDIFEDSFELDLTQVNLNSDGTYATQTDDYRVFFAERAVAPTGWNPNAEGAEDAVYGYFRDVQKNVDAAIESYGLPEFTKKFEDPNSGTRYDFSGQENTQFIWTGGFDASVTLVDDGLSTTGDRSHSVIVHGKEKGDLTARVDFAGLRVVDLTTDDSFADLYTAIDILGDSNTNLSYYSGGRTFRSAQSVSVVGNSGSDVLVMHKDDGRFFDGMGQASLGYDRFVANFAATHNSSAVNWDLRDAAESLNGGVTLFETDGIDDNEVTIRNVESLAIATGSADDFITTYKYGDVVYTNAGEDFVEIYGDNQKDYINLGADDDIIVVNVNERTFNYFDFGSIMGAADIVIGGTGFDQAFHLKDVASFVQYFPTEVIDKGNIINLEISGDLLFSGTVNERGVGFDASHSELNALAQGYQLLLQSISNSILYSAGNTPLAHQTDYRADVEAINFWDFNSSTDSSTAANDLVLYTNGGIYYNGGTGIDTFVADFKSAESMVGDKGGVYLDGSSSYSLFGDTVIQDFERYFVLGTTSSDVLIGGTLDDYLVGNEGNDFLFGGTDTSVDFLAGGAGADVFYYANGGKDTIDGGLDNPSTTVDFADDGSLDKLIITAFNPLDGVTLVAEAGLYYDFFDATGADTHAESYFFYGDTTAVLLTAMDQQSAAMAETGFANRIYQGIKQSSLGSFNNDNYGRFIDVEVTELYLADDFDDLLIYQGDLISTYDSNGDGADDTTYVQGSSVYQAGERANDQDTFVANFSAHDIGIEFIIQADDATSYLLENGVRVQGIDRAIIKAGSGSDTLFGGEYHDYFHGGAGDDSLYGGAGNDELRGGAGDDTFFWMAEGYTTIIGGQGSGGTDYDIDMLIMSNGTSGNSVTVYDIDSNLLFDSRLNPDSVTLPDLQKLLDNTATATRFIQYVDSFAVDYSGIESVNQVGADSASDLIIYRNGVAYSGGNGTGSDIFVADMSTATEQLIFDTTAIGPNDIGNGVVIDGFERFVVKMGSADDLLIGGDGADIAYGGSGNDKLFGGLGENYLDGGDGDDTFTHVGGTETILGGSGDDELLIKTSAATTLSVYENNSSDPLSGTYSNADENLPLTRNDITGLGSKLFVGGKIGLSYGSTVLEFRSVEKIYMDGSSENDLLVDGVGGGVLKGGDGNDVLVTRIGNEGILMDGGSGADTYVFLNDFSTQSIIRDDGEQTSTIHFMKLKSSQIAFSNDGIDLIITGVPESSILFNVRFVNFFKDSKVGKSLIITTTDKLSGFTHDFTILDASDSDATFGMVVNGTENDDALTGTAFDDEIFAGAGDDFIQGSAGADLIVGSAGDDFVSYANSDAAIRTGTSGTGSGGFAEGDILIGVEGIAGSRFDDYISGDDNDNTLAGGAGDDYLRGGEGFDVLIGGKGNDELLGSARDDYLYGDEGDDKLYGGIHNDYLSGGVGNDRLNGGDGDDILEDGEGDDIVLGGQGADTFFYTAGFDRWYGGSGADLDFANFGLLDGSGISFDLMTDNIVRTFGSDKNGVAVIVKNIVSLTNFEVFLATKQNDDMAGSAAAEAFYGGLGDDRFTGNAGADVFYGGEGSDLVDYSRETGAGRISTSLSDFDPNSVTSTNIIDTYGDEDTLFSIENIRGSVNDDRISGNNLDNFIDAHDGEDRILGRSGNDIIFGGAGNDPYLGGGEGDDYIDGGDGNDFIFGWNGDDILLGGRGADLIYGEDGNDRVIGGRGRDLLYGGAGLDTIDYSQTGVTGNGISIDYSTEIVLATGLDIGTDTLHGFENTIGSRGNDVIVGSDSEGETYSFFEGYDTFNGGGGSDTISFEQFHSAVQVDQSTLVDGAFITQTRDQKNMSSGGTLRNLVAATAVENIIGSDYDDVLTSRADGQTTLYGGKGDDVIAATGSYIGYNILHGGDGNDRFIQLHHGNAVDGGDGIDWLDFDAYKNQNLNTGLTISLTKGVGNDDFVTNVENIRGTAFDDILIGNEFGNVLIGGLGQNIINAGAGNDVALYMGGFDIFRGFSGNDTFDVSSFSASVIVDLSAPNIHGNVMVSTKDTAHYTDSGTRRDIAAISTTESFVGTAFGDFISGDSGANMLHGGLGDDDVYGKAGDDIIVYSGGSDRLYGGDGDDTVSFVSYSASVDVDLERAAAERAQSTGTTSVENGTLVGIAELRAFENMIGSIHSDRFSGTKGSNFFTGLDGDDHFIGRGGDDKFNGGAGLDTIDYSSSNAGITISLLETNEQDTLGAGKILLVDVENIVGTSFDDTLIGNNEANVFRAGAGSNLITALKGDDSYLWDGGSDIFYAGGGVDSADFSNHINSGIHASYEGEGGGGYHVTETGGSRLLLAELKQTENVTGTAFDDEIWGTEYNNVQMGGDGDDVLYGSSGADTLNGGDGIDLVDYSDIPTTTGVTISLVSNTGAGGLAEGDTLINIENVIGTNLADSIEGDENANLIRGGGGDDTISGGAGADKIYTGDGSDTVLAGSGNDYVRVVGDGQDNFDGGSGKDYINYHNSIGGVTLNLSTNTASGGWADDDIVSGFESVTGSKFGDDHITGTSGANTINTSGGNDRVYAGQGADKVYLGGGNDYVKVGGGKEYFDGGAGSDDYISYYASPDGITVNLETNATSRSWAADDTIKNFESLGGSKTGDDIIYGTTAANRINTYGGDDRVYAGGGDDIIKLGAGDDYVKVGGGKEIFDGGAGEDYISYYASPGGITIDLAANTVSGSWGSDDKIKNFESVSGSGSGGDMMYGNSGANRLKGYGGNDNLYGRAGDDRLYGGSGNDHLYGGAGTDILFGNAGADTFHFGQTDDHDIIKDFNDNVDLIELDGFGYTNAAEALTYATESDDDVIFDFGNGDMLTVENMTKEFLLNDIEIA